MPDRGVVHRSRNRNRWSTERDQLVSVWRVLIYQPRDLLDRHSVAVKIEDVCTLRWLVRTRYESGRCVSNVLEVSGPTKTNVELLAQHCRFHCLGRITR